jgi:KR domain
VLTGRSPTLPLETLAALAAAGVTVFTVAADAGDPAAWDSLLKWAHEHLPAVQHFAHAAGVTGFDMLQVIKADALSTCSSACFELSRRAPI